MWTRSKWNKIIAIVAVIIAVILAIIAILLPPDKLMSVVVVSRFFEVMLPILAVGALLKYLTRCPTHSTWDTILPACTIFIALVVAILAVVLPSSKIEIVILLSRFFEIMLPVLAVGALIKYLINIYNKDYHVEHVENVERPGYNRRQ